MNANNNTLNINNASDETAAKAVRAWMIRGMFYDLQQLLIIVSSFTLLGFTLHTCAS